ncbi:c-type cytochrome biogenesis protein CcmI [Polynucleobacter sp. MG-5-Ahmo-C2]|jgi:cytochrome c-type biogenesis protein CcmH|uniref:c-type cytochrome biogenesis protein CcmI n=1 Tax=Polynucleobacter sp. MG-5-Ahmo-C2 TaxID=2081051 RepID=UPI001BFE3E16|nr:c-type cytochrome biogenesis protein CcmI [Polynucleobacter sp. MG-5-Ahmo-C2]QWD98140.1 c-type cytochrome biogenesis protein CcmI [Polynucleobacter sp. MG-5-Ahmo-C2]
MTSFLIPAFLLLVLVLVLLLRPFIFPATVEATSRRQMNAAIYREELEKLEAERLAGSMNSSDYEIAHAEMRQRLFQDTNEDDDRSVMGSSKITVIGLCLFITVLSAGFYWSLGDATRLVENNAQQPMTREGVEKMVSEFAVKMDKDPSNLKGWAMLARSYRILGRNEDAARAYEHSGNFIDSDPQLLADYADTLASNANGSFAGKPLKLINQALKLDPNNLMALWLSGTASYTTGDYKAAIQTWEKLAKQLPPGTEEARSIQESISEARSKGGLPSTAVVNTKGIAGKIEISSALKSKVQSGDLVMVIARKPGERMPVAVLKMAVSVFPISFSLTDALAMNPSMPLSGLSEASIEVRISKTGMAKAEMGDLISSAQIVKLGTSNVRLVVDQVRQ